MIKYSYLQSQLSLLRKRYGKENIIHLNKGVIIKNIKVPKGFGSETGSLFLEIPEGYGFGINIMNCLIMLDKKKGKFHLFEFGWDKMPEEVSECFSFDKKIMKTWYWICFHIHEELPGTKEKKGIPKESNMIPIFEYPLLIFIVLKAILDGDPGMLAKIESMNERRAEFEEEYRAMMARFTLELNWKKISWMY